MKFYFYVVQNERGEKMEKPNQDIRNEIKRRNYYMWEVANKLGMHENSFYRFLRKKLTIEERDMIFSALDKLKESSDNQKQVKAI